MHNIELKIMDFMRQVNSTIVDVKNFPLKPASRDIEYFLEKIYTDDPCRPFTIRMSNIGRPLCQLQAEQKGFKPVADDWFLPLKFMYGAIIEGLTMSILRHAGVKIDAEQQRVSLTVRRPDNFRIDIPGTLDVVIDNKVWDIKSASSHSFIEKFGSYEALKKQDTFGYLPQLYGYAKAADKEPGGWIVVDKASGNIKIVEVSNTWEEDQEAALRLIENNVKILLSNADFKRCFEDTEERFQKKLTGNRVLSSVCGFCKYKYSCWPGLVHEPSAFSTAFDKPFKYYTKLHTNL